MNCTQKQQLVCFPKVRVYKPWFRHFNDHKDFRNEGTVHLFSLMALFSYANFRSNERVIYGDRYMEAPGQWICKLGALPRILRVHSKAQALELMEYFRNHGFLTFEILDEEKEILRFTIADWKEHCTHLQYNYYSYKGSGFFFFPLPVGRLLLKIARKEVGIVFSELDAIMDMWLHTILNDPQVRGSEYMPVVYYSNMRGMPLLSYTYLARRWGWSKSRVGRFMLKAGEYGIISRVSFSSSRGSVISMCRYREMIYGEGCEELELSRIGEIIGIANVQLDNLYTVLDISELTGELLPVGMFVALDYVWDKAKEDRTKEKAIFIDEAWELIGDDDTNNPNNTKALAGEWVQEIFKIIRGYGGAAIAATQDIGDLDRSRFGKGILNVAKTKIILNLENDEAQRVQHILHLSDAEIMSITRFERGQGLISTNSNHITVSFKASPLEKQLITTDRMELNQILKEKIAQNTHNVVE